MIEYSPIDCLKAALRKKLLEDFDGRRNRLAEKAGIGKSTLTSLLNLPDKKGTDDTWKKIATALGFGSQTEMISYGHQVLTKREKPQPTKWKSFDLGDGNVIWFATEWSDPQESNEEKVKGRVVELEHARIIHQFRNKILAKNINRDLVELERLSPDALQAVAGHIKAILDSIQITDGETLSQALDMETKIEKMLSEFRLELKNEIGALRRELKENKDDQDNKITAVQQSLIDFREEMASKNRSPLKKKKNVKTG